MTTQPENPLIPVVAKFDHPVRRALYAAANRGDLRRHRWQGCALERAAATVGRSIGSCRGAARALHVPKRVVVEFVEVWDNLRGDDASCTALLRDALERVGLFDVPPRRVAPSETAETATR
jgi:hypothetical protein